MTPLCVTCPLFLLTLAPTSADFTHPLSEAFINIINGKQSLWKAGLNFPTDTPLERIQKLMGTLKDTFLLKLSSKKYDDEVIRSLPENFDSRYKWPDCPTLNEIRDQGSCGSCWAFGAVEAMTDRVCIYSNATQHFHFSAQDLLSCCPICGFGCNGGLPTLAWEYWKHFGIVSGGNEKSSDGCRPYEIPACKLQILGRSIPCSGVPKTRKCFKKCQDSYEVPYDEDKRFGKHIYSINGGEDHIRAEIFMNGPVQAAYTVYTDFVSYKSGVYKHTVGDALGGHSIKILGWGVENGNKYWLIANSWNSDWGENGFFRMIRGEDDCGIESSIIAGIPLLD